MKVASVLVVCVGNICRSPLGERLLHARLPGLCVTSAGLSALVGSPADETAALAASEHGISLDGHVARQLTEEIGADHDLILALEPGHRSEILRRHPHLAGRTFLIDQWTGGRGIPDPFRRSMDFHRQARDQIEIAAETWAKRLK